MLQEPEFWSSRQGEVEFIRLAPPSIEPAGCTAELPADHEDDEPRPGGFSTEERIPASGFAFAGIPRSAASCPPGKNRKHAAEGKRNFQPSHARPDDRLGTLRNAGRVAKSAGVESRSGGWGDCAAYFFLGRGLAPGSFSTPFGLISPKAFLALNG